MYHVVWIPFRSRTVGHEAVLFPGNQHRPAGSRHDYFYRVPSYLAASETLSNGSVIGEFEYTITASTDLRCFTNPLDPPFPTGAIILSGGTTNLGDGLTENNLRILFNSAFAAANPRAFARFRVLRRR